LANVCDRVKSVKQNPLDDSFSVHRYDSRSKELKDFMDFTYLDNNATTQPAPEVVDAINDALTQNWANPNSVHRFGQMARRLVDESRASVARLIGCQDAELFFTGCGTESVNTAIRGLLLGRTPRRKIITSSVEHSATREFVASLGRDGFEIVSIDVDQSGHLDLDSFTKHLNDDVALVSLMWANNETGVLFPIKQLAALCKEKKIPIHTDMTQCVGKISVDVVDLGVDCASFAAHKFHGPKGVGALYTRRGVRLRPYIIGGPQERGRRGGTENVPGIVGMGVSARLAREHLGEMDLVREKRDRLESNILERIPDSRVNGDRINRVPNTTNIGFAKLQAEAILLLLSEQGICASAGAACSSGSLEPSHVLKAMNIDPVYAFGAIRFSLSRFTTDAEIDRCLNVLPTVIEKLRKVMPMGV